MKNSANEAKRLRLENPITEALSITLPWTQKPMTMTFITNLEGNTKIKLIAYW
jgi:hypothetical protein